MTGFILGKLSRETLSVFLESDAKSRLGSWPDL